VLQTSHFAGWRAAGGPAVFCKEMVNAIGKGWGKRI